MKILFCNFDNAWHTSIINGIVNRLHASAVTVVSGIHHELENENIAYHWVDNKNLTYHQYAPFQDQLLPEIDSELLQKMLWCEELYIPMLDRDELVRFKQIGFRERKSYYYEDLRIGLHLLEDIDVCLFGSIPHVSYDFVLFGLCRTLGIPYVIQYFCPPVLGKYSTFYFLEDIFDHIPALNQIDYQSIQPEQLSPRMQAYFDYYGRKKDEIQQITSVNVLKDQKKRPNMLHYAKMIGERNSNGLLGSTIRRKVSKFTRTKAVDKFISSNTYTRKNEKYIYFPLHYQPECTSLPMGGAYWDQTLVIRLLSENIQDDVQIYVRPHPNRSWFADVNFYQELLKCKNVRIISVHDNSYDLIDNSLAVVSLTGTSILEGLVRGKPVLMFGYYIWQYAPGVFHCKTSADVEKALCAVCCEGFVFDEDKLKKFFCALDQHLYDGSMNPLIQKACNCSPEVCLNNLVDGYISYVTKTLKVEA